MNTPICVDSRAPNDISSKEATTLLHFAMGKTTDEAALIDRVSTSTIKRRTEKLFDYFDVHNKTQLVAQAFAKGYLRASLMIALTVFGSSFDDQAIRNHRQSSQQRLTRTTRRGRDELSLDLLMEYASYES